MSYCNWDTTSELNIRYHDNEWGVPLHDDRGQFEFLMMEVMQCGLNWDLMIKKREIFRSCFDNFEYDLIAEYDEADIERIMNTEGMIRSERKIRAIINNAKCFQKVREQYGSLTVGCGVFPITKRFCITSTMTDIYPSVTVCRTKSAGSLKSAASNISVR